MDASSMRSFDQTTTDDVFASAGEWVHKRAGVLIGVGIFMIIVGALAVMNAVTATVATVYVLGTFLILGGIMHAVNVFTVHRWNIALLDALAAILYIVAGFFTFRQPAAAAVTVTIMLAVVFMVGGAMRIVGGLAMKPANWGWVLLHGVVTFLLGLILFMGLPVTGLMGPGILVGVDLIFSGASSCALGAAVRRATDHQSRIGSGSGLRPTPA